MLFRPTRGAAAAHDRNDTPEKWLRGVAVAHSGDGLRAGLRRRRARGCAAAARRPVAVGVSDRARLFVALDLDDKARRALVRWRDEFAPGIPGTRPVTMDALHVTLCFLGNRSLDQVDAIAAACAVRSAAPITGLRLGGAKWLPRRRPRVLAATIEDDAGALANVQSAIADALVAGGWYQREKRPFLAHVTVARVGGDRRAARMPDPSPPPPVALADAGAVTLYRSHLSPRGSRYEALRVIRIDGGGKPGGSVGSPAA